MQLPTISLVSSSDTEDDEAEVEVFLPSKQLGSTALDLDALIAAAEGTMHFSMLVQRVFAGYLCAANSCSACNGSTTP